MNRARVVGAIALLFFGFPESWGADGTFDLGTRFDDTSSSKKAKEPYFEFMERYALDQAAKKGENPDSYLKARVGIVELGLYRLGFYRQPLTGKRNAALTAAIKRFQTSIGADPSGTLLMGEFHELNRREELVRRRTIVPENEFRILKQGDIVIAEGTWAFRNGEMRYPIQTSEIRCDKGEKECVGVTASVIDGEQEERVTLNLDWRYWEITKWTDDEIVAENDASKCVAYTLTISSKAKSVFQFRRGKGAEECEDDVGPPEILELLDGPIMAREYYRNLQKRIKDFYATDFIKSLKATPGGS